MNTPDEACFAAIGAQAAIDNTAKSGNGCLIEGEPIPGLTMTAGSRITADGEILTISQSGKVTILAGCSNPDEDAKLEELYKITQEVAQRIAQAGTKAIPEENPLGPQIIIGESGIHYVWMQAKGLSEEELFKCDEKIEKVLTCVRKAILWNWDAENLNIKGEPDP